MAFRRYRLTPNKCSINELYEHVRSNVVNTEIDASVRIPATRLSYLLVTTIDTSTYTYTSAQCKKLDRLIRRLSRGKPAFTYDREYGSGGDVMITGGTAGGVGGAGGAVTITAGICP